MMHYDESRLADLILHEMTHATLWIRNEVQFNEEFATFVGRQGARDFLEYIYGIDTPEVVRLDEAREESARYRKEIQTLRDRLERLYQQNIPDEEKRQQKATEIARFREYIAAHFSERFHSVVEINNAYIDLFTTYTGNIHLFEELHRQLGSNLAVTIAEVQRRVAERPPSAPAHDIFSLDSTTRGIEN
jgi:predicted aminopeptidase